MSLRYISGDLDTQNAFKSVDITTKDHEKRINALEGMIKDLQDAVKTIPAPVVGAQTSVSVAGSVSGTSVMLHFGPNGQLTKVSPSTT